MRYSLTQIQELRSPKPGSPDLHNPLLAAKFRKILINFKNDPLPNFSIIALTPDICYILTNF